LLALNHLWNLNWPRERLADLAIGLGADVPFFIGGSHAVVEGIGERLTPIRLPGHGWRSSSRRRASPPRRSSAVPTSDGASKLL
jgi:4-diphosphocytidyl-2C-methyl-D-erythritol kinase